MTTGDKVLAHLQAYRVKPDGGPGQWRCISPLRAGADGMNFTLRIDADGEHGAWDDKSGGESGSLYDLAKRLKIELPQQDRPAPEDTLIEYRNLAEYAARHGVPESAFVAAKWAKEPALTNHPGSDRQRLALEFPTATGKRYRFVDGQKPKFKSEKGYKACWYGLKRAVEIAQAQDLPLVICNGEPSVIVAQHFNIPACAITGGEQAKIPAPLLDELKAAWHGTLILAMDCDETGRKSAAGKQAILQAVGYKTVWNVDLGLGEKGDLADFCKLHTDTALSQLQTIAQSSGPKPAQGVLPVVKRSERLSGYIDHIHDYDSTRENTGIPFPMRVLHKFGGMAHTLKPGKIVGIVGVSGGGKTSLLETLVDGWLRYKVSCLVWSPEWTADEFVERAVQRYGGPRMDDLYRHDIFIDERQRGIKNGFGRELNQEQFAAASEAVAHLRKFESEVGYLDMPMLTVSYLRESLDATLHTLDFKPRILVIDYVQLLVALEPGNPNIYNLIMQIKAIGAACGLCVVLASQVTKTSAKSQTNGKVLDAMDARYVNDDPFNLFITINPDRDNAGNYLPSSVLNVAKNSLGVKGRMRVATNWEKLSFADAEHPNQNIVEDGSLVF